MTIIPKISETEWEVMKVIWNHAPCSASDIIDRLAAHDPTWHPRTVKTLLNRLVKKKALGYNKESRAYLYRPLVAEKDCVRAVSQSFLERVFGGALQPMLAHLIEEQRLSSEDIRELKRILSKKED